ARQTSVPNAHRPELRSGRRRCYWSKKIRLRSVGRYRESREPHGEPRAAGWHSGDSRNVCAPENPLLVQTRPDDQGERKRPGVELLTPNIKLTALPSDWTFDQK